MYYKITVYPTASPIYVKEEDLDVIVSYFTSHKDNVLILDYLSEDELKLEESQCFIELKANR